jgi:hypothetical protein
MKDKVFVEAHKSVKEFKFNPTRKDFLVHATLLIVPKRKSEV